MNLRCLPLQRSSAAAVYTTLVAVVVNVVVAVLAVAVTVDADGCCRWYDGSAGL